MSSEDYSKMTEERLQRKLDQEYDMAGLARQDGDAKDAERHMKNAEAIKAELRNRY